MALIVWSSFEFEKGGAFPDYLNHLDSELKEVNKTAVVRQ